MEVERTIEFILDNLAKLASAQVDLQTGLRQLEATVERVVSVQEGTLAIVASLAHRMDELTVSHQRLVEAHQRLTEAQAHTEEKLNALISVVDGIIRPQQQSKPS